MVIIEDSRETSALTFKKPYIDMVVRSKLDFGDYSAHCDGHVCPIYFERKSIGDLFGTLTTGYKRFKQEVNRSIKDGSKLVIIIEVSLSDILKGYEHSTVKGESIAKTLFTLMVRHHIPFVCCTSRREMANYISEFYYAYFRNIKEGR